MGGTQAGLIIGVRHAKDKDITWPQILMAVLSAVLLAAGVLRHYVDIYLHRTVRGISFIFVGLDAAGDVFSLLSVIFQPTFDVLGAVIYSTELLLWIGIFACGAYYNFKPWMKEKLQGKEDVLAADGNGQTQGRIGNVGSLSTGVTLHDLPSSTSVFRTTSGDIDVLRRNLGLGRDSEDVESSE